jgi:hypothetical protein
MPHLKLDSAWVVISLISIFQHPHILIVQQVTSTINIHSIYRVILDDALGDEKRDAYER